MVLMSASLPWKRRATVGVLVIGTSAGFAVHRHTRKGALSTVESNDFQVFGVRIESDVCATFQAPCWKVNVKLDSLVRDRKAQLRCLWALGLWRLLGLWGRRHSGLLVAPKEMRIF